MTIAILRQPFLMPSINHGAGHMSDVKRNPKSFDFWGIYESFGRELDYITVLLFIKLL